MALIKDDRMTPLLNKKVAVLLVALCLYVSCVNAAAVPCQTNVFEQKSITISQSLTKDEIKETTLSKTLSDTSNNKEKETQPKNEKKPARESRFGGMLELLVPARLRKL